MTDEDKIMEILAAAASTENGVEVETSSPERLRQKMYPMMKALGVAFTLSFPPDTTDKLWVIPR